MSTTYYSEIMRLAPLGYWPLNDAPGSGIAKDVSGHGRDGTIVGGVTFGEPPLLKASTLSSALFDGSTGYITASNAGLAGLTALSIICWVNWTAFSSNYDRVISYGNTNTTYDGFNVYIDHTSHHLYMVMGNGSTINYTYGTNLIVSGTTTMVVFTFDGTHIANYQDGSIVGTPNLLSGGIGVSTDALTIGSASWVAYGFMPAKSAHIALIPSVLSADQIAWLWNVGRGAGGIVCSDHRAFGRVM